MPDAYGNFKGIALSGKAAETLDRIFKEDAEILERLAAGPCEPRTDPAGECPWGYDDGCPIGACPSNRDNRTSDQ